MKRYWLALAILTAIPLAQSRADLTSEVRDHAGKPALYVNGQWTSQILAAPYRPNPPDYMDFEKGGVNIFNVYFRFAWSAPETYDFSGPDGRLQAVIDRNPNARFIPRILLTPQAWFGETYPDEITQHDDGTPAGTLIERSTHPSFSSPHYRELSHKAMIAVIHHIEEKFGDHIVGYQVGNGFGGEWLTFNSFWETRGNQPHPTKFGVEDYSPAAKKDFRRWLREKYKTESVLQKAWGDTKVTFESAEPPNEVERYSSTHGIFFDPGLSSRVPDYFTFFNDSVATVLLENAAWIKELTGRKKIVGAFFGYLWCNFPNLSVVHSGHLGFTRVLNSSDIDFLCSPYTYDNKYVGGPNNSQSFPEEAQMHGKLYLNEDDTETHLTQRQWRWGNSLNNPTTWEETKGLLTRDFAYSFTKGFGLWWTDLFGGTFHDDQITKLFADVKKLNDDSKDIDRSSTAEICAVLDESAFTYCGDGEPLWNALLTAQKQWELGYIGAPWEPMLLSDISSPKMKDYKVYIFLNTFHVTPAQREAIHAKLKKNGATAIWVYAPGYIDQSLSAGAMSELTGIKIAENDTSGELHVDITNYAHEFTKDIPKNLAYGTDVKVKEITKYYDHQVYLKDPRDPGLYRDLPGFRINPRFFGNDPQATTLGTLADVGQPGLLVKKQDGWTSIYSSAPLVPAEFLRGVMKAAGCQIYSDGNDVVYACKNFLCVYSPKGGKRTIHLPQLSKVTDALSHELVAENAKEFPLEIAPGAAVLYHLEF